MFESNGDVDYKTTPSRHFSTPQPIFTERRLASHGIVISLIIIAAKLYFQNEMHLHKLIFETELIKYEAILTDGEVVLNYTWKSSITLSKYWLPLMCGLVTGYFTWLMVYLDSKEPGLQPPSPFSPNNNKRSKSNSGPALHLNYSFALVIGVLVTFYTYLKGYSLEY